MTEPPPAIDAVIALHREGRLDDAERGYRAVLAAEPTNPDALHYFGLLQHQRGRSDDALAWIWKAIQAAPRYVDAWVNLGSVLVTRRNLPPAERAFREALAIDERHVGAWLNLGQVLRHRDALVEAAEAFTKVVEFVPKHPIGWRMLAGCLRLTGPLDAALDAHREALRLAPEDLNTLARYAELLYMSGDREGAQRLYRDWLAMKPGDPFAEHGLAACGGAAVPARASDDYVAKLFDQFAASFDEVLLERLDYRAPQLLVDQLRVHLGTPDRSRDIADLGCGTGLCVELLRPFARRLVGVDLSPGMLERAAERGGYDALQQAELTEFLGAHARTFDVLASADTLCYFGALDAFARVAHAALRAGGWLGFSVEALRDGDEPYRILRSGRYAHREAHIVAALTAAGFATPLVEPAVLRTELGEPVHGFVVIARRDS